MTMPMQTPPQVMIRRVRPDDRDALWAFYANLSPASRHDRFLGFSRGVSDDDARSFCTPDHMHDEGFVAVSTAGGRAENVVGHLCMEPAGPNQVELAVAVADRYQGQGIGRRLLEAALEWAHARGVKDVVASAFLGNSRVLRLLGSSPYGAWLTTADGGVVDVTIPLEAPLPSSYTAVLGSARKRQRRRQAAVPGDARAVRAVWRRRTLKTASGSKRASTPKERCDARTAGN